MRVVVRVRSARDDVEELAALWRWLGTDADLGGRIERVDRAVEPTDLSGGLPCAIGIAVSSTSLGVALARSLSTYLRTRRPRTSLTLEVDGRKGTVTVANGDDRHADAAFETLREFVAGEQAARPREAAPGPDDRARNGDD
jgi:hypothetical protein